MSVRSRLHLLAVATLLLSGCATVVDIDPEQLEYDQMVKIKGKQAAEKADPFDSPPTPNSVVAGRKDHVIIFVTKTTPIQGPMNIKLDRWNVRASNFDDESKCVALQWRLQDFEFESEYPTEFFIAPQKTIDLGRMHQTIWSLDGLTFAIPPSGYLAKMNVREADIKRHKYSGKILEEESCIEEDAEEDAKDY